MILNKAKVFLLIGFNSDYTHDFGWVTFTMALAMVIWRTPV